MENSYYLIKTAGDLSANEIDTILKGWQIADWQNMAVEDFAQTFRLSEFHLLHDENGRLLAVARINFDFHVKINGKTRHFPELVGLIAVEKNKGFGTALVGFIKNNLAERDIEAIGFCEAPLRPFYKKCGVGILYGQAKFLQEPDGIGWAIPADDDVLNISLKPQSVALFNCLNEENLGYLVF